MNRRIKYVILLVVFAVVACAPAAALHTEVTPEEEFAIGIGERIVLAPTAGGKGPIRWKAGNDRIAVLSTDSAGAVTLIGMKEGRVRIACADRRSPSRRIRVVARTIRILAVGNSFSEDAVEHHLHELAAAAGVRIVVGNLHAGGCSLGKHLAHVRRDAPAYSYRKIDAEGKLTVRRATSLREALRDEAWDYICLQQVSYLAGNFPSWKESLPELMGYVRMHAAAANPVLMLHQTWAYARDAKHTRFADYDRDQMKMYRAVVDCVSWAAAEVGIDLILPCGTAIQNGRTSSLGDTFCRDGFHLERTYGRYTAACVWFEKIFNRSVVGNPYAPPMLTNRQRRIAQHAAHYAVLFPDNITDMSGF